MFAGLKQRWAEARGDVLLKEAVDSLGRIERFDPPTLHFVQSGFSRTIDDLGPVSSWSAETRKKVAKKLRKGARKAFGSASTRTIEGQTTQASAFGVALLATFYEAQDTPSDAAAKAKRLIEAWAEKPSPYSR